MADMVNFRTSAPARDRRRASSDITFITWAAIASIGLIVAAYALTVSPALDPDQVLTIFAAP
jgi:hypothetical protein